MDKISLWIDTQDRLYQVRLAEYFHKYYAHQMEVRPSGSRQDGPRSDIPHPWVLLTDDVFGDDHQTYDKVFLLSETGGIHPYQPAGLIADQILDECRKGAFSKKEMPANQREEAFLQPSEPGKLYAFWGTHGGMGVTTMMFSCGKELAVSLPQEQAVLCLTTDMLLPSYTGLPEKYTLGDLIYSFLEEDEEQFRNRLISLPQSAWGISALKILPPAILPDDVDRLTASELNLLLEAFRKEYAYVLIDLGSRLTLTARRILEESDRIFRLEFPEEADARVRKLEEETWQKKTVPVTCDMGRSRGKDGMALFMNPKSPYLTRVRELLEMSDGIPG